jgi:uncharacterized membrane protein
MDINININFNNKLKNFKIDFILISILLIAIFLRFYKLDFQGAWLDELHTLKEGDPNLTFKELHEVIMWREGIPHFYFILIQFFGTLFTHTLFSIRLLSAICGVLAVFSIFLLGKEMKGKNFGYVAAIFLSLQPFHIEYSQEGRSYSLMILFIILSFYRLILFLKQVNLKNAILLGLFLGLITNAHPIGIVNVISVFLIIIIAFFIVSNKKEKINYVKYTFITGIVTLIVFSPVYQIVSKVSDIQSFWVQKPTFEYVNKVLITLSGGVTTIYYATIVSLIIIVLYFFKSIRDLKKEPQNKQEFLNSLIIIIWAFFFFIFILLKSQGEASLILNRYLISLVPVFVLALTYIIFLLKNKYLKALLVLIILLLFSNEIFFQKKYYSTRLKAQFNDLTEEVNSLNVNNETIISNWGWLLSYYLDRENIIKNVYEKNLDNHINDFKTNSIEQESFWYLDGNSRPYSVLPETEQYLNENFILDKKIELYDCWARHYISKKAKNTDEVILKLNQFRNAQFDGSGNLMFFENSKSISPKITLESGNYQLEILAMSFPQDKIKNENAKFKVFANSELLGEVEASENKLTAYTFNISSDKINTYEIEIEFINDYSEKDKDRNLQISKIQLLKTK